MGVSSTQVGDHWGSARTVQPNSLSQWREGGGLAELGGGVDGVWCESVWWCESV